MDIRSEEISKRVKNKLENKNPDLYLYIEDPYIEELINNLIDIFAEEIASIKNEYISKKELHR